MNASEWLLSIAEEVEADPSRWTQGAFARHSPLGCPVNTGSKDAACWCASGFMRRDDRGREEFAAIALWCQANVPTYNDNLRSYKDFVAWFRGASEIAKQEEAKEKCPRSEREGTPGA